ncbi:MAG: O-antigen ligase family protein [Anaerolineae bacterium]|nr:MAG: O-antigen ligase family protein [Anaerolineae bacterium]
MTSSRDSETIGLIRPTRSSWGLGILVGVAAVIGGLLLAFGGPIAGAAVILALIAAGVVLRDIEIGFWGVILVVCLLPFATIPVDIGLTPTLLDIIIGATVGIWILRLVIGQSREIVTSVITVPLIIFIIVTIFSFIFGLANGPLTANLLRHFAELLISIGFVLVIIDYFTDWGRIERLVKVIILGGTATAAVAIFIWLLPDLAANDILNVLQRVGYPGGQVLRYIEDNPELAERAIGTSVDPNALGGMLLLVGALVGAQVVSRKPLLGRRITVTAFGLILIALVLTFSRGAMVGFFFGLLLIAIARYRKLIPYMLLIIFLFLLLPITQDYIARFLEGFQGQDLATQMRFGEYRDAIALIGRYPIFGVGFAGSPDIDLYLGVANVYLTIGQQMGLVGLIAFFSLVMTVFGYAYINRRYFRRNDRTDSIWLGLHAALLGGLVVGIFDHYLFNIDFQFTVTIFWIFIGLSVAATRVGKNNSGETVCGLDGIKD